MKGFFKVNGKLQITLPKGCINETVKDIVNGFFYRSVEIEYLPADGTYIQIGKAEKLPLVGGEGRISVTEEGVYITAINERSLLTCLFLLLQKVRVQNLEEGQEELLIPVGEQTIAPNVARRMIHFCVYPNVSVRSYQKVLRLVGVLGYTHVVLEFCGTLEFACLKELAWKNAHFTKAEVESILQVAKDLRVEVIPMVNSFAHASASGTFTGKHVILDQNPRLATLCSPDGSCWNFENERVWQLFRQMRAELYELFGEGEYFHIGFDEGFSYPWDERSVSVLCNSLERMCKEVLAEGRIPMIWADQLLHETTLGISLEIGYEGNAPTQEIAEKMLSAIPKEAILCDWQYYVKETPWISAKYLVEKGYEVMTCPFFDHSGIQTAIKTAEELNCYGVMHTTWDKFFSDPAFYALFDAYDTFFDRPLATKKVGNVLENASILRKISFAEGVYEQSGFVDVEMPSKLSL